MRIFPVYSLTLLRDRDLSILLGLILSFLLLLGKGGLLETPLFVAPDRRDRSAHNTA
jgi:hypothetical protein